MTMLEAGNPKQMKLGESRLVPELRNNLFSVRAVDCKGGAVVFMQGRCFLFQDGTSIEQSGVLGQAVLSGRINEQEQYVLHADTGTPTAYAAEVQITDEEQLWHRRFNYLGLDNLKRASTMVTGMPKLVAKAGR